MHHPVRVPLALLVLDAVSWPSVPCSAGSAPAGRSTAWSACWVRARAARCRPAWLRACRSWQARRPWWGERSACPPAAHPVVGPPGRQPAPPGVSVSIGSGWVWARRAPRVRASVRGPSASSAHRDQTGQPPAGGYRPVELPGEPCPPLVPAAPGALVTPVPAAASTARERGCRGSPRSRSLLRNAVTDRAAWPGHARVRHARPYRCGGGTSSRTADLGLGLATRSGGASGCRPR